MNPTHMKPPARPHCTCMRCGEHVEELHTSLCNACSRYISDHPTPAAYRPVRPACVKDPVPCRLCHASFERIELVNGICHPCAWKEQDKVPPPSHDEALAVAVAYMRGYLAAWDGWSVAEVVAHFRRSAGGGGSPGGHSTNYDSTGFWIAAPGGTTYPRKGQKSARRVRWDEIQTALTASTEQLTLAI